MLTAIEIDKASKLFAFTVSCLTIGYLYVRRSDRGVIACAYRPAKLAMSVSVSLYVNLLTSTSINFFSLNMSPSIQRRCICDQLTR